MNKTIHVKVEGYVQGVGFRYATLQKALNLNIAGWVKNESTGSVSTLLQGSDTSINAMIQWLDTGPPSAKVTKVTTHENEPAPVYTSFKIIA